MNFELKSLGLGAACKEKSDLLVVLVAESFEAADDALSGLIAHAIKGNAFQPKDAQTLQAYRVAGVQTDKLVLAGVGAGDGRTVRKAVAAALSGTKAATLKKVVVVFAAKPSDEALRAATLALGDACYVYNTTKPKQEPRQLQQVTVGVAGADAALKGVFAQAVAVVRGVDLAKEWGNRPANNATPTLLAEAATALGKLPGIECEVLLPKDVAKLKMGSFMAVAQGSEQALRFIVLKYQGAERGQAPVVLVGKGITFDTGGISLKPAAEMDEMKFDMCGAASVLGVFQALSELRPRLNVVGLIPTCENMPSGKALKPGDVVTSMSGQTIEVLNTDAEGRLILCDALTYAERFKPQAVVDIATLTGACMVALGGVRSGLFASDDALAQALQSAGDRAQDLCWRLPLDEEYGEGLKSNFADVANVAGRAGGAVTAAKFLQRFASKFPWAHLDIAGTAWKSGAAKGASGRPVGLLVEYLLSQQSAAAPAKGARKSTSQGRR